MIIGIVTAKSDPPLTQVDENPIQRGTDYSFLAHCLYLTKNQSETERFLQVLDVGGVFTFQTFDDSKRTRGHNRIHQGTFAAVAGKLRAANKQGAGVFVMVNQGNGRGRKAQNVTRVRALVLDLDGAPLDPVLHAPLVPHLLVETSPGRYHAYWLVEGCELADFSLAQKALAARFGGDPKVSDLSRVMRLPGFLNQKAPPGTPTTLLAALNHPPHAFADICRLLIPEIHTMRQRPRDLRMDRATQKPPFQDRDHNGGGENGLWDGQSAIPEGERNSRLFGLALSLHAKGYNQAEILARISQTNSTYCSPPLASNELATIVQSVASYELKTFTQIPHWVLDRAFGLGDKAFRLLLCMARRYNGRNNGNISIPFDDMKGRGIRSQATLTKAISDLIEAGLIRKVRDSRRLEDGHWQCALYELMFHPEGGTTPKQRITGTHSASP